MTQQPTMQVWTDAWHKADAEIVKQIYVSTGLIFPPNKPAVQGNQAILDFMKGGLGKVDVVFQPHKLIMSATLAFEYGVFQDIELYERTVVGEGKYAVTWVLENGEWKIQCHTWSMPVKQ